MFASSSAEEKAARRRVAAQALSLSSSLRTGMEDAKLYLSYGADKTASLQSSIAPRSASSSGAAAAPAAAAAATAKGARGLSSREDASGLTAARDVEASLNASKLQAAPEVALTKQAERERARAAKKETAGKGWFDLPATELTADVRRDIRLLRMRNVLDPKRHYRANDNNKAPKYFSMGTIVAGAADKQSDRLSRRERKATIADELVADDAFRRRARAKFVEINAPRHAAGVAHKGKRKASKRAGGGKKGKAGKRRL